MLKEKDFQDFNDSLERCLNNESFIPSFYERFIQASPQIRRLFQHTDMERQFRMLRSSIYMCMLAARSHIQARGHLTALGDKHSQLGVRPLYYSFWLESLIASVEAHDPKYSDHVEGVWRAVMAPGVRMMIARYTGSADDESDALTDDPPIREEADKKYVGDTMTSPVVTVDMDDPVAQVSALMERHRIHHLVVLEEGKPVGIISDRDLKQAMSPFVGTMSESERDLRILDKRAHQIMTRHPVSVIPGHTVEHAARLLVERSVSCLPVLDADTGELVGILSWRDLLRTGAGVTRTA